MIASASVTENGAEATIANTRTESGTASQPRWAKMLATSMRCETTSAASTNDASKIPTASMRRSTEVLALTGSTLTGCCLGRSAVYASACSPTNRARRDFGTADLGG